MSFGFSLSDLMNVSNLAIKLYRRCKESPHEFMSLSSEVANLRILVDDIRMTVKEYHLNDSQTENIINLGQGCLDCLLDLEALLRKYHSLGTKTKRGIERLGWEKEKVCDMRQRLIANTGLLNAFNISLTRSSQARIEALLRGFLEDHKAERHEASILSLDTVRSIQQGDDDVWNDLKNELENAGITEEQITDNKQFITEWIVNAIQSGGLEQRSVITGSFHTATDGGGSNSWSGTTLRAPNLAPDLQFSGPEYRWTKELARSVDGLYRDAPEPFTTLQSRLKHSINVLIEVGGNPHGVMSLAYHEKLSRKPRMLPVLEKLNDIFKSLQDFAATLRLPSSDVEAGFEWTCDTAKMERVDKLGRDVEITTRELDILFSDLGTMVLCNLDDRIRIIVNETEEKQRSASILSSWDELETELVDNQEILEEDVRTHEQAIKTFLKLLLEDGDFYHHSRTDSLGACTSASIGTMPPLPILGANHVLHHPNASPQNSRSSLTESDSLLAARQSKPLKTRPKRASVLFVDLNNTVRSPMAQAYLQYLLHEHETLATQFSRVSSAGLAASKPGVPLSAGVDFMLRDYGICNNGFAHISRRLERRDVKKFEYVLTMNNAQRDDILAWSSRDESSTSDDVQADTLTREDLEEKVRVLGSFGSKEDQDVPILESIYGEHWFFIGTKRIYPGYDKCFQAVKAFVGDFVYYMTGFDVHAHTMSNSQELDSREMSQEVSDDEGYAGVWQSQWGLAEERSGFEELSRAISHYEDAAPDLKSNDGDPFSPVESPIQVIIKADQQPLETDEEVLHRHHEQFDRLVSLLLTDIGDYSLQSLRKMVLDWEEDSTRNILAVSTGNVQWVLEKISMDSSEACNLCTATNKKSGFVRDQKLEVITVDEADLIARYLGLAIEQSSQQQEPSEEQARDLERIRDSTQPRPAAPPSIRDDVSISVRNDKPQLQHEVAKIRERETLKKHEKQKTSVNQDEREALQRPKPVRRKTGDSFTGLLGSNPAMPHRVSNASAATVKPYDVGNELLHSPKPHPTSPSTENGDSVPTPSRNPKKASGLPPVSVLFLGATHLHGPIMAEVYLFSRVEKSMALSRRVNDVVSAGVANVNPDQKLNPKKLERLFRNLDIIQCWPQKPERQLVPEDVIDFSYILTMEDISPDIPYQCWEDENGEEADEMRNKATKQGTDWKANFATRVEHLRNFDEPKRRDQPLMDPVQPYSSDSRRFGVRMAAFEKHFDRIKYAVDHFLLTELKFDVESNKFLDEKAPR